MNPADEYALELALRVKDKLPGTHITVITMAQQCADTFLRTAVAMGADEAVLTSDMLFIALLGWTTWIVKNVLLDDRNPMRSSHFQQTQNRYPSKSPLDDRANRAL